MCIRDRSSANPLLPDPHGMVDQREMQPPPGAQEELMAAKRRAERMAEESATAADADGDEAMNADDN
eukprot:2935282-Amphidinium_carterae.1